MNVLMLGHSDAEGGAAVAARRLQRGLQALGMDARMLVRRRTRPDDTVIEASTRASKPIARARFVLDKLPLAAYPRRDGTPFSTQWLPDGLASRIAHLRPDLLNLHWVGHGTLHPATLRRVRAPVVWTLHDVEPFTGGCHVNLGCARYETACGACPRLGGTRERDLSRAVWQRKQRAWRDLELTLVAPSRWMADCARRSALFQGRRLDVIPHGLDLDRFRPADRRPARARLALPPDKKLVLFPVASGRRVVHKGFDLLEAALAHLEAAGAWAGKLELVTAGPAASAGAVRSGFRTHHVGPIADEDRMSALYAAADLTVVPSRQETLSLVAVESLACGTPVVAFDGTGLPDVVDDRKNGVLVEPFDPEALARGFDWVLRDADRHARLCAAARAKAERCFDLREQAGRYVALFRDLLARAHAQEA